MRALLTALAACGLLSACNGGGGGAAPSAIPAIDASTMPAKAASPTPANASTATPAPAPHASPGGTSTPTMAPTTGPTIGPIANPTSAPVLPAPQSAPAHIPTLAYDEYWAEGSNAPAALVARYVTYAEGGYGNAKAHADCDSGPSTCSSVFYVDPNFIYASPTCPSPEAAAFLSAADETWFVHESGYSDAAHRVAGSYQQTCNGSTVAVPVYVTNQNNPAVDAFFTNYMRANADQFDLYFMDDTSASVLTQTYGPGGGFCADNAPTHWCNSTNEYPTDASVVAAHEALIAGLNHANGSPMQGVFNGVGFYGGGVKNLNLITGSNGRLIGATCEDCVVSGGVLESGNYARVLNAMAAVNAMPGSAFVEFSSGSSPSGSAAQISQRLATIAVAWLGFSPAQTIVSEDLEDTTTDLAIWPEESIYPTLAVSSMTSSSNDVAVTTGVFVREFAQCFYGGSPIGPCAAVLNSTSAAVTIQPSWLKQTYAHQITLSGGDIESGGTLSLSSASFVTGETTVQPAQALLLSR